jgi:aspartyl protease family protein
MPGMAILEVNGERVIIKKGQSRSGIKLISSNSREAVIVINGKEEVLQLGASVVGEYAQAQKTVVRLPRGEGGHYFATAKINGRSIKMMVDTGATNIALSSDAAKKLGINYKQGVKGRSSTAGGIVDNYRLRLDHIQIGGIKRYNVAVGVIEGSFPSIPLLGMSFLNQVKIHEDQGMLILTDLN